MNDSKSKTYYQIHRKEICAKRKAMRHAKGISVKYNDCTGLSVSDPVEYRKQYWKNNPAKKHWKYAQNRCLYDPDSSYYMRVDFDITPAEVEEIWIRDEADQLLEPSIDRIDNSKGYCKSNVRFVELPWNKRRPRTKREVTEVA